MPYGPPSGRGEWTRWYVFATKRKSSDQPDLYVQIQTSKGEVIITNDGATILKSIQALHPAAKMASSLTNSSFRRNNLPNS